MKQYIQNLMDRYVETKNIKEKQIKQLKDEIDKLKVSKSAQPLPIAAPKPTTGKTTTEQADSGTCS